MKNLLFIFLALIYTHVTFSQCVLQEVQFEEKISQADFIIEGRVLSSQAFKGQFDLINTKHTIAVYKIFKGESTASTIEIITQGGTLGNEMQKVNPSLQVKQGDVGIFFLHQKNNGFVAYSGPQGFIQYDEFGQAAHSPFHNYDNLNTDLYQPLELRIGAKAKELVKYDLGSKSNTNNKASAGPISSISPKVITAGTESVLTITGSGFGITRGTGIVQFPNASSGAPFISPVTSQYVSWSDTEIKVEVPSGAGTGNIRVIKGTTSQSLESLLIEFAALNVENPSEAFQVDHVNDNGSGGYTFRMSTAFSGNANANAAFVRAMNNWIDATCVNWEMGAATTTNNSGNDGTNIVRFGNTNELPNGVLAVTRSYYNSCNSGNVWFVGELDLTYDPDINWNYSSSSPKLEEFDIESVTLHELGHAHQLGHVIDEANVMHRSIGPGVNKRTLPFANKVAGKYIQARSLEANACGPSPMTNFPGCDPAIGINTVKVQASNFTLFPNPANDVVHLQFKNDQTKKTIRVLDVTGKEAERKNTFAIKTSLSLNTFNKGLYLIEVTEGDQVSTKKLMIY